MSISLSDLEKYLRIGNPILSCIAAALFAAKVLEWIINSWAFVNYTNRDYRVIKRAEELKKLEPYDDSSGIFHREISLLKQKLRLRYSRRQFGRYLRMRFGDEASDAAREKRDNPYRLRGTANILYYAIRSSFGLLILILLIMDIVAFINWALDAFNYYQYSKNPGAPGILGELWGLAKLVSKALARKALARKALARSLSLSLLWSILLLTVIGFLLSWLIEWCWSRYLCGYAFKRYIRPSLEKKTRDILVYGSARFHAPGYPKVVETFRNELVKLGNRQTVGPRVAGDLIGAAFPAPFLIGIFQGFAQLWPMENEIFSVIAGVITLFTVIVLISGFGMAIYFIVKSDEALPNTPIAG